MKPALRTRVLREWQPAADAPTTNPAQPLEQLVPGVMKSLGLEQRLQQSQVFFLWEKIVGADIARHAQPVALKNGLLSVNVDHPIWLSELDRYHKPLMLQQIQKAVGARAVRDIKFRIG